MVLEDNELDSKVFEDLTVKQILFYRDWETDRKSVV